VNIVLQTAEILIVEKASGWLTTPARTTDDPRPVLGRELQAHLGMQIYPVHRLDFEVSGLTLWAKTPLAHTRAQLWFEHGVVGKLYEGLSRPGVGEPPLDWQEWKSRLVRGKRRSFAASHGKDAVTRARVIAQEDGYWRWQLVPVTGRPHQLRVEMAAHGCPLIGDTLYGGESARPDWIALRAVELSFSRVPEAERFGLPEVVATSSLSL